MGRVADLQSGAACDGDDRPGLSLDATHVLPCEVVAVVVVAQESTMWVNMLVALVVTLESLS